MTEKRDPETNFAPTARPARAHDAGAARHVEKGARKGFRDFRTLYPWLSRRQATSRSVLLRRVSATRWARISKISSPPPSRRQFWSCDPRDLRGYTGPDRASRRTPLAAAALSAQRRASFSGIALIGLRGAGKSTLGKMLAKKIGGNSSVEQESRRRTDYPSPKSSHSTAKESFRRMERAALGQLLARKELVVLATGGGIVSEPLTFDLVCRRSIRSG